MGQDVRFVFSGAWLLGLGAEDLRPLARHLEAAREQIPEGRYRLRAFEAGIQIVGERPGTTIPAELQRAVADVFRCELKRLSAGHVTHRGSEFLECQYEHWRGGVCLRRLSTAPIYGDAIGWVGVDGVEEPWEASAFQRAPLKGQSTDASDWPRLLGVTTSAAAPVPLGNGMPAAEAEIIGVMPRVRPG